MEEDGRLQMIAIAETIGVLLIDWIFELSLLAHRVGEASHCRGCDGALFRSENLRDPVR
jgi:hypothetical protein